MSGCPAKLPMFSLRTQSGLEIPLVSGVISVMRRESPVVPTAETLRRFMGMRRNLPWSEDQSSLPSSEAPALATRCRHCD